VGKIRREGGGARERRRGGGEHEPSGLFIRLTDLWFGL